MNPVRGEVVLVTGATSGIGRATARAFAREGARLLVAARRVDRLTRLETELTELGAPAVRALTLDVRDEAAVARAIEELPRPWKPIEVLVNNAGLSRGLEPLHEGLLENWNEMIDTNVKGVLHVDRHVLPLMIARSRGTVVHIGSIAGHGRPTPAATCTARPNPRCER